MTRRKVLTNQQREAVRKEYLAFVRGYETLARKYGVGASTIRDIVQGRVS